MYRRRKQIKALDELVSEDENQFLMSIDVNVHAKQ
jgi:hypothetical protein